MVRPDPRDASSPGKLILLFSPLGLLFLSGCETAGISFLAPAGPIAALQHHWFELILVALAIVILPVLVGVPFCLWRYRLGNKNAPYRPDWQYTLSLEYLVWGIPAVIVLMLAVLIWGAERRYSPQTPINSQTPPLEVQVVALNWKWLFIYPAEHVASLDTLALPVGREVRFSLTSDKSMQSFFIPALGSQIYAMAGMVTTLHLRADQPGRYLGENTQFNGMGFQDEKFTVIALPDPAFRNWMTAAHQSPLALNDATYRALLRDGNDPQAVSMLTKDQMPPSDPLQPQGLRFANVPPDFFRNIVNHVHQPPVSQITVPQ